MASFTDMVTACADNATNPTPACDTDDAEVPYSDVSAPPTLTKTATNTTCVIDQTYDVVVTNTSALESLTLNTLSDDIYGNITQVQGNVQSTTCGQAAQWRRCAAGFDRGGWQLHLFVCGKEHQL